VSCEILLQNVGDKNLLQINKKVRGFISSRTPRKVRGSSLRRKNSIGDRTVEEF
jgi:hypothetical protein